MSAPHEFYLKPAERSTLASMVALAAEVGEFAGLNQYPVDVTCETWGVIECRVTDRDVAMHFKFRFSDRFVEKPADPPGKEPWKSVNDQMRSIAQRSTPPVVLMAQEPERPIFISVQKTRERRHENFTFSMSCIGGLPDDPLLLDEGNGRYLVSER